MAESLFLRRAPWTPFLYPWSRGDRGKAAATDITKVLGSERHTVIWVLGDKTWPYVGLGEGYSPYCFWNSTWTWLGGGSKEQRTPVDISQVSALEAPESYSWY